MIKTEFYTFLRRNLLPSTLLGFALILAVYYGSETRAAETYPKGAIVAQGKFFCPIQVRVIMPFEGTVLSMDSRLGQPVRKGAVIFQYRLGDREVVALNRRFAQVHIEDLEIRLLDLEEVLTELHLQEEELETLHRQQLAPKKGVENITRKIQLTARKKQILHKRLQEERDLVQKERRNAGLALGLDDAPEQFAAEAFLRAPMGGHFIWFNPALRKGAIIGKNTPLVQIGIMDPMVIRAQVHEIDAARLTPGDLAEVRLDSIPGQVFTATVQRVPWAPLHNSQTQPTYFEVELSVSNPDLLIKEGFKGQVTFLSTRKDPVK